jgi:hypothetical protein
LAEDGDFFIRLISTIPIIANLRFYTSTADEVAEESILVKTVLEICACRGGVYRFSIPVLCSKLGIAPFDVPKLLNDLQTREKLTYELEKESFCISAYKLKEDIPGIARTLLQRAIEIEDNCIRKLNSIYIAARRLSFRSIDYVHKVIKEKKKEDEGKANNIGNYLRNVDLELAPGMNKLINAYFLSEDFENIEKELAGDLGVEEYLPLIRIDNVREQADLERDVRILLDGSNNQATCFGTEEATSTGYTSLEIIRILLGIQSTNISLTFFRNNPLWAKYNEHDYKDVVKNVREIYIKCQIEKAQKNMDGREKRPKLS